MADLCNVIQAILDLFEILGLTPNAKGLTQDDLKALGIAAAGMITSTATKVSDKVWSNANKILEDNVEAGRELVTQANTTTYDMVNSTISNIENLNDQVSATDLENGLSVVTGSAESKLNSFTENAANTVTSTATSVASSASISVNIVAETAATQLSSSGEYEGEHYSFTITQYPDSTDSDVSVTLYYDPKRSDTLSDYIDTVFYDKSKQKKIFSNGTKRTLLNKLQDIWEANDTAPAKFTINGKVNKMTRVYNFEVSVDKEEYNKYI